MNFIKLNHLCKQYFNLINLIQTFKIILFEISICFYKQKIPNFNRKIR